MARIAGVNVSDNKHTEIALTAIYGIGRVTAKKICDATGITAMNFAKNIGNELLIGSLVKEGDANIEKGTIFKLRFKAKQSISNTTGLFYFKNTDAVQSDGNKLELKIQ